MLNHAGKNHAYIDIVDANYTYAENVRFTEGNAIFETEPKEDVGLDLYYEASNALPIKLTSKYSEQFAPKLAPITVEREDEGTVFIANAPVVDSCVKDVVGIRDKTSSNPYPFRVGVGDILKFQHDDGTVTSSKVINHYSPYPNTSSTYKPSTKHTVTITFDNDASAVRTGSNPTDFDTNGSKIWEVTTTSSAVSIPKGTFITTISGTALTLSNSVSGSSTSVSCTVKLVTGYYKLDTRTYLYETELGWFNCFSFGNGLESDRIRDDFNAPQIDNGVKASTVLDTQVKEERRKHGIIYSGIYNSTSGINNLNQFIAAEKITKDLNPIYGSIQSLLSRDTRLVMFCEDKVLRAESGRDILFNADGNPQVLASDKVIGAVQPYQGNYGVARNPESIAATPYRVYFTDVDKGHVLQLTAEGVSSISNVGMVDYFADIFDSGVDRCIGSYDERKREYNLNIVKKDGSNGHHQILPSSQTTITYAEGSTGWTSFKSFNYQKAVSLNNNYFSFYNGHIYKHHVETAEDGTTVPRNNFYGVQYTSTITVPFNANPQSVKTFNAMSYEGTAARITNFETPSTNVYTNDYSTNNGLSSVALTDGEYYNIEDTIGGWYVESITTNLQTAGNPGSTPAIEFINREGKYFGYICGEATTLSNLDEKEFLLTENQSIFIGMVFSFFHYGIAFIGCLLYTSPSPRDRG